MFGKSEEIAALQKENADLKIAADASAAKLTAADDRIQALTVEKEKAEQAATQEKARADKAEADAKAAAEKHAADLKAAQEKHAADLSAAAASVDKKVTERLASAGIDPIARDKAAADESSKSMTRAEFGKLSPAEKSAFSRAGGKLTD